MWEEIYISETRRVVVVVGLSWSLALALVVSESRAVRELCVFHVGGG